MVVLDVDDTNVGEYEGFSVNREDDGFGITDVFIVGLSLGAVVRCISVGDSVTMVVGGFVRVVGILVGMFEGLDEGVAEGLDVGIFVGVFVGIDEGANVVSTRHSCRKGRLKPAATRSG